MKKPSFSMPEPKVFKEIYALRLEMHRRARKIGWEAYLIEVNQRAGHLLGKSPIHSPKLPTRPGGLRSFGKPSSVQDAQGAVRAKTSPAAEG
jgi:hypothetical protein